ncbi:MAG: D-tyrosyl-tRNA(Tyr) deacylase [Lentisphaerae bacterium]|jgi:D-aminoacyl-tRNA deacylase|nr:D-tyrosyl-tRNA(Tyr) deacylase [Lentisphaerota bacterium]MBT4821381.1 D-tyrosyl-tRNA(Tyr) deacylase [Lentisphaerota bacterium]MBT5610339.1 D-tyrosyl-tRNA(Tyr) deacylase [Lentisphaerota bacterium]MBT7056167.1 D-tyrosyl-tRNA(Tyr) deacylase [Lentisphaerota bacterium]MBT7841911.1 D-tyrosyl-tRNA(Tyr) deacylase [Lentisphaerota bacterium]
MRAVIQRVLEASVDCDGTTVGQIGHGLLILLGVRTGDTSAEADYLVEKCMNLRIFTDADGKFNLSVRDIEGEVLVVSQFTLYGDTRKGRRPSFVDAARPDVSEPLYDQFVARVRATGLKTETGIFGAMMRVNLVNDGPVTVLVERERPEG